MHQEPFDRAELFEDLFLNANQYRNLLDGVVVTLQVLLGSFILGTVMSLIFGVARLSQHRWIRNVALVYIEFARGISAIILLFSARAPGAFRPGQDHR